MRRVLMLLALELRAVELNFDAAAGHSLSQSQPDADVGSLPVAQQKGIQSAMSRRLAALRQPTFRSAGTSTVHEGLVGGDPTAAPFVVITSPKPDSLLPMGKEVQVSAVISTRAGRSTALELRTNLHTLHERTTIDEALDGSRVTATARDLQHGWNLISVVLREARFEDAALEVRATVTVNVMSHNYIDHNYIGHNHTEVRATVAVNVMSFGCTERALLLPSNMSVACNASECEMRLEAETLPFTLPLDKDDEAYLRVRLRTIGYQAHALQTWLRRQTSTVASSSPQAAAAPSRQVLPSSPAAAAPSRWVVLSVAATAADAVYVPLALAVWSWLGWRVLLLLFDTDRLHDSPDGPRRLRCLRQAIAAAGPDQEANVLVLEFPASALDQVVHAASLVAGAVVPHIGRTDNVMVGSVSAMPTAAWADALRRGHTASDAAGSDDAVHIADAFGESSHGKPPCQSSALHEGELLAPRLGLVHASASSQVWHSLLEIVITTQAITI